jgi:hypothetical protein
VILDAERLFLLRSQYQNVDQRCARNPSSPSKTYSLPMDIPRNLLMSFGNGTIFQRKKALPATNIHQFVDTMHF